MFPPVEIMDTTLRDGEQTSGVSFNAREKLSIARLLLEELHVSRIEIASARVSQGEQQAVRAIAEWAAAKGYADRVEALGFIDGGVSLDWLGTAGCRVVNLLAKGSRKHCEGQLRRTPERHLEDVRAEILAAVDRGMKVNLYLEDWSNGMRRSPDYVYAMLDGLADAPVSRFMCPDTLGVLDPYDTERFCRDLVERYPSLHFDFHAHNDYDLAVANTAAAVRAGFHGVHVTVNGLGERAGNAPLSSAVAVLHDRLGRTTGIDETKINRVSRTVESYTGIRIPANRPIVGASVFTQCAGIHADGDSKNNLYFNELLPERFGRVREYALGKTSGKANVLKNLEALGIDLDEAAMRKVTERVVELSDKKEQVTAEDLPYIIADVLRYDPVDTPVRILNYSLSLAQGMHPVATLRIEIHGCAYERTSAGDGQYDAFMRALRQIYREPHGEGAARAGAAAHAQIAGAVRQPAPRGAVRRPGRPFAAPGGGGPRHGFHLRARTHGRHLLRPSAGPRRGGRARLRHLHLHGLGDRTGPARGVSAGRVAPPQTDGRRQGQRAGNLASVA